MSEVLEQIAKVGIVPLAVLNDPADAVPLAEALRDGGIPVAEVTFRTPAVAEAIARIAAEVPDVLVGAGTVHTVEQAERAVRSGAKFIVTPGIHPEVVNWCIRHEIAVVPGVASPSDVEMATHFGLNLCKFFPAEAYGGVKTLKALAGPYQGVRFLPTGGVNETNMLDYLNLPNVAAVGGSFTCPDAMVKEKQWDDIRKLCRELIYKTLGFELAHVGVNTRDEADARQVAERFSRLLGLPVQETPGSFFSGGLIEVLKGKYLGDMGHIAINTRDIGRAKDYLSDLGVAFDESTAFLDESGRLKTIYLREMVGGFAVHLRQK